MHRETLSLYRDILRATRFFMWPNSGSLLWRDILRENARRREFELARFETDSKIVTRFLIGAMKLCSRLLISSSGSRSRWLRMSMAKAVEIDSDHERV
ncbi:Complex 1 LYR protein [Trema orientale]|uniref:Complex 1 LYR protein n=1 Tax=Trema orientale TaxID=63057 RepID=A0A2P5EGH3_TREOI|nr:Complex 1 LYR protein [Trema orientale]